MRRAVVLLVSSLGFNFALNARQPVNIRDCSPRASPQSGILAEEVLVACGMTSTALVTKSAHNPIVQCGHPIPVSALRNPKGAELENDPPARALAAFLADQEGVEPVATHGYRVLYRDENEVEYAAGEGPHFDSVGVRREGSVWEADSSGSCRPEVVREGFEVARWQPAEPPRGRKLHLIYETGTCFPGDPPQDRFVRAEASETRNAVTVVLLLTPEESLTPEEPLPELNFNDPVVVLPVCAGVGLDFERLIILPSRLKGRQLLDGSTYPARVAASDYP